MDSHAIERFVDGFWEREVVPTLCEYIRIPNKSPAFDSDWARRGHMDAAVALLETWCRRFDLSGLTTEVVRLQDRTPMLVCEVAATPGVHGSVLMYGHYDKQPEFTGWSPGLDPWQPVLRDGRLYGRGGADDGYALFGSLGAIAALQAQGLPHARCLILIEGCEESGSFDLPHYIDHLAGRIGEPELVVCLDAECGNYDQLWLTTSLRGMVAGTLDVRVLTEGVHSGAASGLVPSSFRILRGLLDRIEDAATGVLPDTLHTDVPESFRAQAATVAETLGQTFVARFPWAGNTQPMSDDLTTLVLNTTWRPTLSVTGLSGAPAVADAGNTLRPGTQAKLSVRLPPTADAPAAAEWIRATLERDPPYGADVQFVLDGAQSGWAAPDTAPWLAAALEAGSKAYFGQPLRQMGTGGSIPFMRMLGERFPRVQFMVTGVLGPHSNAHGPNEFLDIRTGKRVTCCVAGVLSAHAASRAATAR
jgi:acetylornithine deacetylase/succinyl-diaminopimelate desuccinylase-like protein